MGQIAIYLDEETARRVDRAAKKEKTSRSAWVCRALKAQLAGRLPDSFFAVLGTFEDPRDPKTLLRDIRQGVTGREREPLD